VNIAERARVVFVVGPTGVGKTSLAIELARRLGAEIINCDSRQVYIGMDIGTAKPTAAQRACVPHHLLDVREPSEPLDAASFAALADSTIADIHARRRRALVVGGSGLYFRALRWGIFPGPRASEELRTHLRKRAAREGYHSLYEELRAIDPDTALRLAPRDLKRVIRALEVFYLTGVPLSVHHARHRPLRPRYESLVIGLTTEREKLYRALDARFDQMLAAGLVEEVQALLAKGYDAQSPALTAIGYKQLAAYLRGEVTLEEAARLAKRDTRRFAKRQLTWFRAEPGILWMSAEQAYRQAGELLEHFFAGRWPTPDASVVNVHSNV